MSPYCFHYRFEADLRFNGGDPVYTCGNCNTIVARASKVALKAERDTRAERDRLAGEVKAWREAYRISNDQMSEAIARAADLATEVETLRARLAVERDSSVELVDPQDFTPAEGVDGRG